MRTPGMPAEKCFQFEKAGEKLHWRASAPPRTPHVHTVTPYADTHSWYPSLSSLACYELTSSIVQCRSPSSSLLFYAILILIMRPAWKRPKIFGCRFSWSFSAHNALGQWNSWWNRRRLSPMGLLESSMRFPLFMGVIRGDMYTAGRGTVSQ